MTYNHAAFITQALDSVLAQQTTFPIEILVGEDDSTDGTRDIVKQYAEGHAGLIRPFFNRRKDVIQIEGLPTGRRNLVNNLRNARGEYVALLEGDDYWIDPAKLQRQVECLDARPDCSFCFHRAWVLDDETGNQRRFHDLFFSIGDRTEFSVEDLLLRWVVPSASVMFRKSMLKPFPGWYFQTFSGDQALQLLLAHEGNGLMLDAFMSVYRRHPGGISNRLLGVVRQRSWARMHHAFNAMHGYRYDAHLARRLAQEFSMTARPDPHLALRPLTALKDLQLSLLYGRRAGELSLAQCLAQAVKWCRLFARVAASKTARRLRGMIGHPRASTGSPGTSGTSTRG